MNLTAIFEKIVGKQKQRELARIDDFRKLVTSIAAGDEPDPDDVDRILRDTGKALDDLRGAIELRQRRLDLRAKLDQVPALEAERKDIEHQMAMANEALAEAERQHDETMNPLLSQRDLLRQAIQDAELARQHLVKSCPYVELTEKLQDLERRHAEAGHQASELRQAIDDCCSMARSDRANALHARSDDASQDLLDRADRRDAHAALRQKELADVMKQVASLEKQIQAIRNEMLVP